MGSGAEAEVKLNVPAAKKKPLKQVQPKTQEVASPDPLNPVDKTEPSLEGTVAVTDFTVAADLQDLDEKIKSMMMFSEKVINSKEGRARICKVCGKEGSWTNIRRHI